MKSPKAISRPGKASLPSKASTNEKLDEALDESFPASDPVAIGHSEHAGEPRKKRKKASEWPKGAVGLKGKVPK